MSYYKRNQHETILSLQQPMHIYAIRLDDYNDEREGLQPLEIAHVTFKYNCVHLNAVQLCTSENGRLTFLRIIKIISRSFKSHELLKQDHNAPKVLLPANEFDVNKYVDCMPDMLSTPHSCISHLFPFQTDTCSGDGLWKKTHQSQEKEN